MKPPIYPAHIDHDRPTRIRPGYVKRDSGGSGYPTAYLLIARRAGRLKTVLRRAASASPGKVAAKAQKPYAQRCAIRVTYSRNKTDGAWKAHGKYLARDSATINKETSEKIPGEPFDAKGEVSDLPAELARWQALGDQRMWRIIISPEFGDKLDLKDLTRDVLSKMEHDLGRKLEWVAVAHFNTHHPHVHVALRGVAEARNLTLPPAYVKSGIRAHAEHHCNLKLGYRTPAQAKESQDREVLYRRITSLDKMILKQLPTDGSAGPEFPIDIDKIAKVHREQVLSRLQFLATMNMARQSDEKWLVQSDLEQLLRALNRATEKMRIVQDHGTELSDQNLPFDAGKWTYLEGRVIVHGQDEYSGKLYLILEGTDGKLHHVPYSTELEAERINGRLKRGSFVQLNKRFIDRKPLVELEDFGPAKHLLTNRAYFENRADQIIEKGKMPARSEWKGWLGDYHRVLRETIVRKMTEPTQPTLRNPLQ